ncbi:hypothetical protein B0H19DRAFT_1252061 [Mycena capillaripes]|nr:hypothetical protein B0H19DRAFT_1252061 [Mycena capillaripes]
MEGQDLDDYALAVLVDCCPALESLLLNYCGTISDAAFLKFIIAKMTGEFRTVLTDPQTVDRDWLPHLR